MSENAIARMQVKATIAQFRFHYNETPVEHKDILTMIICKIK